MIRHLLGALAAAGMLVSGAAAQANDSTSDTNYGQQIKSGAQDAAGKAKSGAQDVAGKAKSGAQQAGDAAKQATTSQSVNGTIQGKSGKSFTVLTSDQQQIKLDTGSSTQVLDQFGQKIDRSALKEGDQVQASYRVDGSKNKAERVQVMGSSSGAQKSTSPDSNTANPDRGYENK